jgi:hypothetical protein
MRRSRIYEQNKASCLAQAFEEGKETQRERAISRKNWHSAYSCYTAINNAVFIWDLFNGCEA